MIVRGTMFGARIWNLQKITLRIGQGYQLHQMLFLPQSIGETL